MTRPSPVVIGLLLLVALIVALLWAAYTGEVGATYAAGPSVVAPAGAALVG